MSFTQSPTYQLSKYLSQLLSPLLGESPSAVWNSKEFAEFIWMQNLNKNECLVSFNVVSLFTNVPTDLAIDVAHSRLERDESLPDRTTLTVGSIIEAAFTWLRFCCECM